MNLKQFADNYRVKIRRDSCGDAIISGKKFCKDLPDRVEYRSHIFDHGDCRFGVCLQFMTSAKWTYAKQRLTVAGFTVAQNGDTEGTLLFDPINANQAKAAIKEAGVRYRKVLSEETRRSLTTRLKRASTAENGQLLA